jgi:hypothetical protein
VFPLRTGRNATPPTALRAMATILRGGILHIPAWKSKELVR